MSPLFSYFNEILKSLFNRNCLVLQSLTAVYKIRYLIEDTHFDVLNFSVLFLSKNVNKSVIVHELNNLL